MFLKIIFLLLIAPSLFANSLKIVALGDSVTVGYGVAKQDAYPAVLQKKLQKKYPGLQVINAGSSGSTTASAISSLKWQLKHPFQILILCLGGNDGLRGLKLESSEKNISKVIAMSQANGIKVLLVGMRIPKNYGLAYRKKFEEMYRRLALKHKVPLMPFLLKGVGAVKELNLADGIHPNEKGYIKVAENLLPYVEKLL